MSTIWGIHSICEDSIFLSAFPITAIEFGAAGGNGLFVLENHAAVVEKTWGVKIDTLGCDMGSSMPERSDGRDCPFAFQGGEFAMDERKLRSRL